MSVWQVSSDPKTAAFTHRMPAGLGHALLTQALSGVFRMLRLPASIWVASSRGIWFSIHEQPALLSFEVEHGRETERQAYNTRHLSHVKRRKKLVVGTLHGHADSFVPIVMRGEVNAVLVTGPFALERPTSETILERWRELSGRHGHPTDPEFSTFLSTMLSTLVLDGDRAAKFQALLGHFARLLAGEGAADELATKADAIRVEFEPLRYVERSWEAVRTMLDERSPRTWASVHRADALHSLGLPVLADRVLVGLAVSRSPESDPVDEAVRRDAFQRRAVELARSTGSTMAGRIGDHGVVFLSAGKGGAARRRQHVLDLAARSSEVARREFGLVLHFGASHASGSAPISHSYQSALSAAELALIQKSKLVEAEPGARTERQSLTELRRGLLQGLAESPTSLPARFERYLEAVAASTGYRVDLGRAYLDAGFERIAEALLSNGVLDEKSLRALSDSLDCAASSARTVNELSLAYRRALLDLSNAMHQPAEARQDRSLKAALTYIREHYTEPLRIDRVAREAGFAPKYFSRLFSKHEHKSFERYLLGLRLERAKELLSSTDLQVARVAGLSGFGSVQYFCHMFRRELGRTPLEHRRLRARSPKSAARQRLIKKIR